MQFVLENVVNRGNEANQTEKNYLTVLHPEHAKKKNLEQKKDDYCCQKIRMMKITTFPEKAQRASYLTTMQIVKRKNPTQLEGN